jgi:UDP-3-O-[3-hydroxymyristoyl] glucosamine N-acyltransferase
VTVSLRDLADLVGGEVLGDPAVEITGISSLELAEPGQITFIAHVRHQERLKASRASAVIVSRPEIGGQLPKIVVGNPYLAYAKVAAFFHPGPCAFPGVSPSAVVHPDARLGVDVSIGPLVWVDRDAQIGDRVTLFPGVCVGEGCVIGEDTVLYPRAVLYPHCRLGRRVIVHAGAVIGSDGFGFAREGARSVKIPQLGTVLIDDDVEIGANAAIDRASFGTTWIQRGVKIDNLVQIGHNVRVGEDSILAGQVGLAGSVEVGRGVTLAGQVGVANHLRLGDGVLVASKSGVAQDIPPGSVMSGIPAIPHRIWLRSAQVFSRLPQLLRRLRAVESALKSLEREIHGSKTP